MCQIDFYGNAYKKDVRVIFIWRLCAVKTGLVSKRNYMQKQPDAEYMMCVRGSLIRQLEQPEGHRNTKGNLQWAQRLLKTV